jgi:hypothetical protein
MGALTHYALSVGHTRMQSAPLPKDTEFGDFGSASYFSVLIRGHFSSINAAGPRNMLTFEPKSERRISGKLVDSCLWAASES